MKGAKNIVIVGGGTVGVELACEILETYAGKSITILHRCPTPAPPHVCPTLASTPPRCAGKSITIVHPAASLFEGTKISAWVQKWLFDHGVKVGPLQKGPALSRGAALAEVTGWILLICCTCMFQVLYGERAKKEGNAPGKQQLESGKTLDADLVIWTVGATPNTAWLKSTDLASALDTAGRLKVRPH